MGVYDRAEQILKSNVNAMLDKMEDPEKMIDQVLLDLADNLAEVKRNAAAVIAEKARTQRLADNNKSDIAKYEGLARKALSRGNEDDARAFIARKRSFEAKMPEFEKLCVIACQNAEKVREAHDKLVNTIEELKVRRSMIKAKIKIARTQDLVGKFSSASTKETAQAAYERMEEKADSLLDQSNAMTELNDEQTDEATALEARYGAADGVAVDDELQKLKREMGIQD